MTTWYYIYNPHTEQCMDAWCFDPLAYVWVGIDDEFLFVGDRSVLENAFEQLDDYEKSVCIIREEVS